MIERKVRKGKKGLTTGLTIGILTALFLAYAPPTFPQQDVAAAITREEDIRIGESVIPTADNFGVEDASGDKDTNAVVPVIITNAQNGPVVCIIFDIAYDKSVINVMDVQKGTLTSFWDSPVMNNFEWGTRVSIVYDGQPAHALQNASTGSVVLLNFSVTGNLGETSMMNTTNIQLADTTYQVGTAPPKNGTFSISTEPNPQNVGMLNDTVENVGWSEAYWTEDGLWHISQKRSGSPTHSWWYGKESTSNYDTGGANSGCLISQEIDLTDATDATLNFWTYWQTEDTGATWDKKLVEISTNGGATWALLQQLSGSMQGNRALSLHDYVGNDVMIRFRFNTVDKYYNNYEGWFIDDITVKEQAD